MFWIYGCLAFLCVLLMVYIDDKKEAGAGLSSISATHMAVWHEAAVEYAHAHPGAQGLITENSLILPSGYRPAGSWKSLYEQDIVTTWAVREGSAVSPHVLAWALGEFSNGAVDAGIVVQGKIRTTSGAQISVTPGVPDGVSALMTRVK